MVLGVRQQVKIWKLDMSRHYTVEISLNVTLNHNQPTNQPLEEWETQWQMYFHAVACNVIPISKRRQQH